MSSYFFRAAALVVAALGCVTEAGATGLAVARFGGEHGNVTEGNPTALYFNPWAIACRARPRGSTRPLI